MFYIPLRCKSFSSICSLFVYLSIVVTVLFYSGTTTQCISVLYPTEVYRSLLFSQYSGPPSATARKIFSFFTYVPRFKNDILVVQDSKWPPNVPPRYLPKSVTLPLANLCETTDVGVDRLWSLLREVVWVFDEKQKEVETRFKAYGKGLSYREPARNYCNLLR